VPLESMFKLKGGVTRGHSAKFMKNRFRLDLRRYFFSERVVNRWNRLDQAAIDSCSVNAFKKSLERTRTEKMGYFMDQ
jgi:hypothetical protein